MIFKAVTELTDKKDRSLFLEQINIYIRLVEVFCQKKRMELPEEWQEQELVQELVSIGVIRQDKSLSAEEDEQAEDSGQAEDMRALQELLQDRYAVFLQAVAFARAHCDELEGLLDKLYNSRRRICQVQAAGEKQLTLVDFFCGAGGLSLGFLQAGFQVKLANDIEDVCVATYRYNHPELPSDRLIQGDIKQIVDHIEEYDLGDIDVVVGGPPCQGFSEANRQRIIDDPRNKLYKYFVRAVEKIAPKIVVMENVKGMQKVANQVVEDYEKLRIRRDGQEYSYKVCYELLNAQDFSVAQSRERLIYIAVRSDVMREKEITPKQIFKRIEENCSRNSHYVLADVLRDIKPLEAPRIRNQNETDSEDTGKKIDINAFEENQNAYLGLINQNRVIPYTYNHKARYCSDINYEIYRRMNPGDDATDEKIKDIMPYAHRNHCFKDKYYKLIAEKPCRTITAHLRMDCHSHIHPTQVRSLTPREAARAQSFPDDYLFMGAYLKTYMQVGNAVPPLMARGIASVIREYLDPH